MPSPLFVYFFTILAATLLLLSSSINANPINIEPFNHPVNGGSHSGKADHDPRKSPPRFVQEMPCTLNTDQGWIRNTGYDLKPSYQTVEYRVYAGTYQDSVDSDIHVPLTATLYKNGTLSVLGEVDAQHRPSALQIELKPIPVDRKAFSYPQALGWWKDIQELAVCKVDTDLKMQMIGGFEVHQR